MGRENSMAWIKLITYRFRFYNNQVYYLNFFENDKFKMV